MAWTDEEDAQLRALWAAGHSTARIGALMRLSKNAVIGRAHRLLLPSRASPILATPPAFTAEQAALLRQMVRQGFSAGEVAARLGVTAARARREAAGLGLHFFGQLVRPRSYGVRTLTRAGAAVVAAAHNETEKLRAEAFRRHAQPGGGVFAPLGPAAHPIPAPQAVSGVPARAGYPEAVAGCGGSGVSSLDLPPAVVTPRPEVFSGAGRACRWPLWSDTGLPDHRFCGAPRQRGAYCAEHGARAYVEAGGAGMPRAAGRADEAARQRAIAILTGAFP